jgi:hypothetical protein
MEPDLELHYIQTPAYLSASLGNLKKLYFNSTTQVDAINSRTVISLSHGWPT